VHRESIRVCKNYSFGLNSVIPVHQLFIDFKKAYDSVRREVLYKILIEFGIPRATQALVFRIISQGPQPGFKIVSVSISPR